MKFVKNIGKWIYRHKVLIAFVVVIPLSFLTPYRGASMGAWIAEVYAGLILLVIAIKALSKVFIEKSKCR